MTRFRHVQIQGRSNTAWNRLHKRFAGGVIRAVEVGLHRRVDPDTALEDVVVVVTDIARSLLEWVSRRKRCETAAGFDAAQVAQLVEAFEETKQARRPTLAPSQMTTQKSLSAAGKISEEAAQQSASVERTTVVEPSPDKDQLSSELADRIEAILDKHPYVRGVLAARRDDGSLALFFTGASPNETKRMLEQDGDERA